MAHLVFNGGHTLRVPGSVTDVENALTAQSGLIPMTWVPIISGSEEVRVNPHAVSYIVSDEAYDSTFGSRSNET